MRISKSSKDSVEKILPSKGDLSDREQLIKLASETPAEEKSLSEFGDMKYQEALDRFKKNNPGATEEDFLKAIIRIPLGSGGSAKIIKFSDYKDPAKKVKEIDLQVLLDSEELSQNIYINCDYGSAKLTFKAVKHSK